MQLELRNIDKCYGNHIIFDHMSFSFANAGFYLISGVSGSGKTTLLNLIAGYESFDHGERNVEDVSIACIFQNYELIFELTVLENIRMSVDLCNQPFDESLMDKLGLKELMNHYPNELSGGQKQRVGIARALYQNPDVIICDEPTEALDVDNKEIVLKLLKELSKDKVVIVACHEFAYIQSYYDYHYEIQECKLKCIDVRRNKKECISTYQKTYNLTSLRHYIHKIIHRRNKVAVICFSILLCLQIMFYLIDYHMFMIPESMNALNQDSIYVSAYENKEALFKKYKDAKPIMNFKPVSIGTKRYKVDIYPLENKDYIVENNEIIINQHMLFLFEGEDEKSIKGKKVVLSYELLNNHHDLEFIVKEVVEEKDVYNPQIYYSEDMFMNYLKKQEGTSLYASEYDYFIENANQFEIIQKKEIEPVYHSLKKNAFFNVSHSVLDTREQMQNQMFIYHILFLMLEIVAFIMNVVFIIYFGYKDNERNKTALSLMHSLGIPIKVIKKEYGKQKVWYMGRASILLFVLALCLRIVVSFPFIVVGFSIVSIMMVYVFVVVVQLMYFKKQYISMILKDNKDK